MGQIELSQSWQLSGNRADEVQAGCEPVSFVSQHHTIQIPLRHQTSAVLNVRFAAQFCRFSSLVYHFPASVFCKVFPN